MNTEKKPVETLQKQFEQTCAPDIKTTSEILYQRLFDVTYGYLASTIAVFFFLVLLLPAYCRVSAGTSTGSQTIPAITNVLNAGWFISLFVSAGFFAGGVALFNSMRAGRAMLKYMFTLCGLIILFELKYFMYHFSNIGLDNIITAVIILFSIFTLFYIFYKAHCRKDLGTITFLNFYAAMFNFHIIIRYFISFSRTTADWHVHYLSLIFLAALSMQAYKAAITFFPLFKWSLRNAGGIIPDDVIRHVQAQCNRDNIVL
ncbi:MAG: hypothetical protein ACD_59C00120G0004 [uncultured bacterium]|nr:MAG: hypothetical protein ACD_59C00120G0004 [uncultured bacterium]